MADFENKNNTQWNGNNAAQNNAASVNTNGANGAADPYAYQNGYYRNTTPHQDEAVHSGSAYAGSSANGSAPQTPPTGNGSGNNGGYTYVNYYTNPNGGDPNQKPKKKHTGLKVAAFVLAMVLVSGGSIGVYEGIRSSSADNGSSIVASNETSSADSKNDSSSNASNQKSDSGQSWIQLASTNGSMSVADIVKKVTPSVVGVQSTFTSSANGNTNNSYGGFFGYGNGQSGSGSQGMTGLCAAQCIQQFCGICRNQNIVTLIVIRRNGQIVAVCSDLCIKCTAAVTGYIELYCQMCLRTLCACRVQQCLRFFEHFFKSHFCHSFRHFRQKYAGISYAFLIYYRRNFAKCQEECR